MDATHIGISENHTDIFMMGKKVYHSKMGFFVHLEKMATNGTSM
jgi:hypothetical protein